LRNEKALIIIDVQSGVVDWSQPTSEGSDEVLIRINELLVKARGAGSPVIYVQHDGQDKDSPVRTGSPGWEIHPAIAPAVGEMVIHKRACDAFFETTLESELATLGVKHLVVAGCRTQYCVDTSCRSAVANGYDVTLAKDAHMTVDTENLKAVQIIAHHNETLDELDAGIHMIRVRNSREISF
jgi:nicotinamidase-related amidase